MSMLTLLRAGLGAPRYIFVTSSKRIMAPQA